MAWMLSGEMMPMSMLGYGIMGMLLVSSFVGSMVSAGVIKRRRLFVCLTHGGLYLASLLLINGLFFGGEITGVVPTALLLGGGVGAAALVGLRQPGLVRRRNIKRRTG